MPLTASLNATQAPEIEAQRVPPSACRTSQSIWIVNSPSFLRSTAARRLRPIRRWISCVRPDCLPLTASRSQRVPVDLGSRPYSAVTQPSPLPVRKRGTPGVTVAVQSTRVSPAETSTLPSAYFVKPRRKLSGRNSSSLLSLIIISSLIQVINFIN